MSIFSALTELSSGLVNTVMGERIRIVPRRVDDYGATADPSRQPVECPGVYREIRRRTRAETAAPGRAFERIILTPVTTFSVATADLAGLVVRDGDLIERMETPFGGAAFEISACEPDGGARILFTVTVRK